MGQKFRIENDGDGFFTIKDVPIFECHDTRGFDCNEAWMQDCIKNFYADKERGYRPTIIVGHNIKGVEKEAHGFLDRFYLKGKRLFADLVRIPKTLKEKIVQNAYPGRSVEVLPQSKRILALALLGGTTPFFSLPQMVYEQDEQSTWYRSPNMNAKTNGNAADVNEIAAQAAQEAVRQYQLSQEPTEPEIYSLNVQDSIQVLQDGVELFQGEDGQFYAQGQNGEFYQIADSVAQHYGAGNVARAAMAGLRGAEGPATSKIAELAMRGGRGIRGAAESVGGTARSAGNYVRQSGNRAIAKGVGRTRTAGRAAGAHIAAHKGAYIGGAAGAATLAGGAYLASRGPTRDQRRNRDYQVDNQGVVYSADGNVIGQIAFYDDNGDPTTGALPPANTAQPNLVIEDGAVGEGTDDESHGLENDPGSQASAFVQPLAGDQSDQFSLFPNDEMNDYQTAEMYSLKQEVGQLKYANELLQAGRKAETYKSYLLEMKKSGAPVGDVEQQVDFLMSLTDDQVAKYKSNLAAQPKISLGQMTYALETESADMLANKAKAEFNNNRQQYSALGVGEEDLKYANYVRTNTFTNQTVNR